MTVQLIAIDNRLRTPIRRCDQLHRQCCRAKGTAAGQPRTECTFPYGEHKVHLASPTANRVAVHASCGFDQDAAAVLDIDLEMVAVEQIHSD